MTTELKIRTGTHNLFPNIFPNGCNWVEEDVIINGVEFDGTTVTKNQIKNRTIYNTIVKMNYFRVYGME